MTQERYRQLLKRFHPDIAGTHRWSPLVTRLVEMRRRAAERFKRCDCGATISAKSTNCALCYRRRRYGAAIASLSACVLFIVAGCKSPVKPPMPPPLPQQAASFALPVETVVAPPKPLKIWWDYPLPMPQPNVVFELHASPNPTGPFTLFREAPEPPIIIERSQPQQYFILRARDTLSGVVSLWNQ